MKNIISLVLIVLFSSCTIWKQIYIPIQGEVNSQIILEKDLSNLINIPIYNQKMKSRDLFLKIILPGFPLNNKNLSFSRISGKDLISSPTEIDRAYLFSKFINRLLVLGDYPSENGSLLSELYINKLEAMSLKSETYSLPSNYPLTAFTSATYNDEFYLTVLNPVQFTEDCKWTKFEKNVSKLDSFKIKDSSIQIVIPLYNFSMDISFLNVERSWFKLDSVFNDSADSIPLLGYDRVAYIEKIIFARNIKLENFSQSQLEITVSENGKKMKNVLSIPSNKFENMNSIIIGFVYRIL